MQTNNTKPKNPRFAEFKAACARAEAKGLLILPSVSGPYAFNPTTNKTVGAYKSAAYFAAIA